MGVKNNRASLLDIGSAIDLKSPPLVTPTPGHGGTVWYLAPEREMQDFGLPVDIWSMGVIGFELVYGHHPWSFSSNPWRSGNEKLRPSFHSKYDAAMSRHREETDSSSAVENLLLQMLRHPWAPENNKDRINIHDILSDATWKFLLEDEPFAKRVRSTKN
jgi:serine/threonine protein kinase